MQEELIEKLEKIDIEAYKMAKSVFIKKEKSKEFETEAKELIDKLEKVSSELETSFPDIYNSKLHQISEIILDLQYVLEQPNVVSLRIGRLIVLKEQKDKKGEKQMSDEKLVKKLNKIDDDAYEMAQMIVDGSETRKKLVTKVQKLDLKLDIILRKLEVMYPDVYEEKSDQISEVTLDIEFVKRNIDMVSLRIGHYIRIKKREKKKAD